MTTQNTNYIITGSNLRVNYDFGNPKCFSGEPVSQLVYGSGADYTNSYPTYGNGWGTYNTNNYGSGTYWQIGAIQSVSNNIVTSSDASRMRDYDVLNPQTTGGGVTAGTNYFIRKYSTNSFSLHQYDSSQDGSSGHNGFDVLRFINSSNKVSVNATNFPTSWWGAPHLPNSGILKEVVKNGFRHEGRVHDCLRFHYYRQDGVVDGCAYGVYPPYTAGGTFTNALYIRAGTENAIGKNLGWQRWTNGDSSLAGGTTTLTVTDQWTKYEWYCTSTQTAGTNFYWFADGFGTGEGYSIDIAEVNVHTGSYSKHFSSSSRGASTSAADQRGGVWDLSEHKNHGSFLSNPRYLGKDGSNIGEASGGVLDFNGSTGSIAIPNSPDFKTNSYTLELWVYFKSYKQGDLVTFGVGSGSYAQFYLRPLGSTIQWFTSGVAQGGTTGTSRPYYLERTMSASELSTYLPLNTWKHLTISTDFNNSSSLIYIDGVQRFSTTSSSTTSMTTWTPAAMHVGGFTWDGITNSRIAEFRYYNRPLSAAEIKQNFDATRNKYGV